MVVAVEIESAAINENDSVSEASSVAIAPEVLISRIPDSFMPSLKAAGITADDQLMIASMASALGARDVTLGNTVAYGISEADYEPSYDFTAFKEEFDKYADSNPEVHAQLQDLAGQFGGVTPRKLLYGLGFAGNALPSSPDSRKKSRFIRAVTKVLFVTLALTACGETSGTAESSQAQIILTNDAEQEYLVTGESIPSGPPYFGYLMKNGVIDNTDNQVFAINKRFQFAKEPVENTQNKADIGYAVVLQQIDDDNKPTAKLYLKATDTENIYSLIDQYNNDSGYTLVFNDTQNTVVLQVNDGEDLTEYLLTERISQSVDGVATVVPTQSPDSLVADIQDMFRVHTVSAKGQTQATPTINMSTITAIPSATEVPATPTKEMTPTPDPKFHELTQDEIDNLETIKYIPIHREDIGDYANFIENNLKIGVSVQGAKLSESFPNAGTHEIQLNLSANRNIIPRFALEIDGVKMFMYEAKIIDAKGNITQGPLILCESGTMPHGTEWRIYRGIIEHFQENSHNEFIIRFILEVAQSDISAGNPNATKLTNVDGQESTWDPMRTTLKDKDTFTPDMSATIWWAQPMN